MEKIKPEEPLEEKKKDPLEVPSKNPLEDYLLEVEFSHESQTVNLNEARPWEDRTKEDLTQPQEIKSSVKTESLNDAPREAPPPSKAPEKTEKSKIEQLEAVIERLQKSQAEDAPSSLSVERMPSAEISSQPEAAAFPRVAPPILVVYGHHEVMKDEVLLVLEKLGLYAILSIEERKEGLTVFKRFSQSTPTDISFAIVILSGDDFAYAKDQSPDEAKLRSRQSVIFDLGFLVGKLGRDRVFVLYQDSRDFELPTDFFDVLYTPYSKLGGWQLELLRQLKKTGHPVDANKLI